MKIVNVQQHSEEWHQMRRKMIGASMAPIIMGASPWKTPYRLWQEMLGIVEPSPQTNAMRRGVEMEEEARKVLNYYMEANFEPAVAISEEYPWMMASFDGYEKRSIVEIKCPGEEDHSLATKKQIPKKYYWQLQHQMLVAGCSSMIYFSYTNKDWAIVSVHSNEEDQKKLIEETYKFWCHLRDFTEPEKTEKDLELPLIDNHDLETLHERYIFAKESLKHYQEEVEIIKEKITQYSTDSFRTPHMRVLKVASKGRINYSEIDELKCIDLEKYRAAPTMYWKIEVNE